MRPIDLARNQGLSTQAVRNYEDEGILPTAHRTPQGYRVYQAIHAAALHAFCALIPGHGHQTAAQIMRALHHDNLDDALALIDASHAQLTRDRATLNAVTEALHGLSTTPDPTHQSTHIGPLARQLRLRPATLRKWETAGLLRPARDRHTGYRVYSPEDIRDAQLTHLLRRGGYLLEQIAPLVEAVRDAGGVTPLQSTLDEWQERLATRGRALLAGASALHEFLQTRDQPGQVPAP